MPRCASHLEFTRGPYSIHSYCERDCFTTGFPIIIQWKSHFALIQSNEVLHMTQLHKFVTIWWPGHQIVLNLCCCVMGKISWPVTELQKDEFSMEFELWWKIIIETSPSFVMNVWWFFFFFKFSTCLQATSNICVPMILYMHIWSWHEMLMPWCHGAWHFTKILGDDRLFVSEVGLIFPISAGSNPPQPRSQAGTQGGRARAKIRTPRDNEIFRAFRMNTSCRHCKGIYVRD